MRTLGLSAIQSAPGDWASNAIFPMAQENTDCRASIVLAYKRGVPILGKFMMARKSGTHERPKTIFISIFYFFRYIMLSASPVAKLFSCYLIVIHILVIVLY